MVGVPFVSLSSLRFDTLQSENVTLIINVISFITSFICKKNLSTIEYFSSNDKRLALGIFSF